MRFPRDRGSGSADFFSASEAHVSRFSKSKKRGKKLNKQPSCKPTNSLSALAVGMYIWESVGMYVRRCTQYMYICMYVCMYVYYKVLLLMNNCSPKCMNIGCMHYVKIFVNRIIYCVCMYVNVYVQVVRYLWILIGIWRTRTWTTPPSAR